MTLIGFVVAMIAAFSLYEGYFRQSVLAQDHPDRNKFHAEIAHALLEMNTTLDIIEGFRAQESMPPNRDAMHEKAAHGFKQALELFGVPVSMEKQTDRNRFHADLAHALLEMNTTLDIIEGFRAQELMPPERDTMHEKAAHGFKKALELFGVPVDMERQIDQNKFHADVAHALLEMNTTLDIIEGFRAQESMPPNRDAMHEKTAHGFKHALELFGVKTRM